MKVDPVVDLIETEDNINDLNSMDVNTGFDTPDFSAFGLNDENKYFNSIVIP